MFSRVGIATKVEALPSSVYFAKITVPKTEFVLMLVGLSSSSTGDAIHGLTSVLHSWDAQTGMGTQNWGVYGNQALDRAIEGAVGTLDDGKREALLQDAMAIAMNDAALIPLYTQMTIAAGRKGLDYVPRMDEQTVIMQARPVP
jgi:peptide/nickel transport system substrate-binding protein